MSHTAPRTMAARARPARADWYAALLLLALPLHAVLAAQLVIGGPGGSGSFGASVTVLPNGNFVVIDVGADAPGPIADVGAVYLYRPTGTLISTLRGSAAGDAVGNGGVTVLDNGNFVVISPNWRNGAFSNAGAVTFVRADTGLDGVVTEGNSLVGTGFSSFVGSDGVTLLANGNYVVGSSSWSVGSLDNAGAVTLGSAATGISGAVDGSNSLIGNAAESRVGSGGVVALDNGNYVVSSPLWDNGALLDVGAATFGSGVAGAVGLVAPGNSLVGSSANDRVGLAITALDNGNYVVISERWSNGPATSAGGVTFGSGVAGVSGAVGAGNSLVGSTLNDRVGSAGVAALTNGNYVVGSPFWDNSATIDAGAATLCAGTAGTSGPITSGNSLIGSQVSDRVGSGVLALRSGNYVVASPRWDNGALVDAGAATFGSGSSGVVGAITAANSLVGGAAGNFVSRSLDTLGVSITTLSNGNYLVVSPSWDNGATTDVGAVTFGSGVTGVSGIVSTANSLIGASAADQIGSNGITELVNGNYVVSSDRWDNGAATDAGAATFGSGTSGTTGVVAATNSLVGTTAGDAVGRFGATALSNGNYLMRSILWDNGAAVDVGAITIGSGTSGISGAVTIANSRVGSTANDRLGSSGVAALGGGNYLAANAGWDNGAIGDVGAVTFAAGISGSSGTVTPGNSSIGNTALDQIGSTGVTVFGNGNFVVRSPLWDNGAAINAGAVTLGLANGSVIGPLSATHSVLGLVANQGTSQVFDYDPLRNQLVVGQPASNRVVLQRTGIATTIGGLTQAPDPSIVGQPVVFTATVTASPSAPGNGQVTVRASSGETCVDPTPSAASATTATFSCTITFLASGASGVIAEYTGSITHAYSGSAALPHQTQSALVFGNGFEAP